MSEFVRLRDVLVLPSDKYGKKLKPILELVDSVHRLKTAAKIKVIITKNKNNEGEYHYKRGSFEPDHIEISQINDSIEATLLHEVGHFLELGVIPGCSFGQRQWASGELTAEWIKAIKSSKTFKTLQEIHDDRKYRRFDHHGHLMAELPVNRVWVSYLLTPRELWARSYAQWIIGRSENGDLKNFLEKLSSPSAAVPLQWSWEDFAATQEQFDRIFSTMGWLL